MGFGERGEFPLWEGVLGEQVFPSSFQGSRLTLKAGQPQVHCGRESVGQSPCGRSCCVWQRLLGHFSCSFPLLPSFTPHPPVAISGNLRDSVPRSSRHMCQEAQPWCL